MDQLVTHLPHKYEPLSSDPHKHIKSWTGGHMPGVPWMVRGEVGAGGSLEAREPASLACLKFLAHEIPCHKQKVKHT